MTMNDAQLIGLQKYGKKRGFPKMQKTVLKLYQVGRVDFADVDNFFQYGIHG